MRWFGEVCFFPEIRLFNSCFPGLFLASVGQPFQGAYLEISKNPKYKKLKDAVDEKIIIAEVVNKINRANGKVIKWNDLIQIGRSFSVTNKLRERLGFRHVIV